MTGHNEQPMDRDGKVFVCGHNGLVGAAIHKKLIAVGFSNIVTRTRKELDLCNAEAVNAFFEQEKIDYVFVAAGKYHNMTSPDCLNFVVFSLIILFPARFTPYFSQSWRHQSQQRLPNGVFAPEFTNSKR